MPLGAHTIEGRAWSGIAPIASVECSIDDGATWQPAAAGAAGARARGHGVAGRFDVARGRAWRAMWSACRARDEAGNVQPSEPVLERRRLREQPDSTRQRDRRIARLDPGGGAVDSRTTRLVDSSRPSASIACLSINRVSSATLMRPISARGWLTVVRCGVINSTRSGSAKPMIDSSPGTCSPRSCAACTAPSMTLSSSPKDCRRRIGKRQKSHRRRLATRDGRLARDDEVRVNRKAGVRICGPEPHQPLLGGVGTGAPRDRSDPPVAQLEQMLDRGPSAGCMHCRDERDSRRRPLHRVDEDGRKLRVLELPELVLRILRADQDERTRLRSLHQLEQWHVAVSRRDQHAQPTFVGRREHPRSSA